MAECLICGKDAGSLALDTWARQVGCPLCGNYVCADKPAVLTLRLAVREEGVAQKLQAYIRRQNLCEVIPIFVVASSPAPREVTVEQAVAAFPTKPDLRFRVILLNVYLMQKCDYDGVAELDYSRDYPVFFASGRVGMVEAKHDLESEELLRDAGSHQTMMRVRLTRKGWRAVQDLLEELQRGGERIGFARPDADG